MFVSLPSQSHRRPQHCYQSLARASGVCLLPGCLLQCRANGACSKTRVSVLGKSNGCRLVSVTSRSLHSSNTSGMSGVSSSFLTGWFLSTVFCLPMADWRLPGQRKKPEVVISRLPFFACPPPPPAPLFAAGSAQMAPQQDFWLHVVHL